MTPSHRALIKTVHINELRLKVNWCQAKCGATGSDLEVDRVIRVMRRGDALNIPSSLSDATITPKSTDPEIMIMAFVITDNCIKDALCVDACPVDCIHPRTDEPAFEAATQMYVNPAECIDCGACIPACTSDAIFALDEVPADKQQFITANEVFYTN